MQKLKTTITQIEDVGTKQYILYLKESLQETRKARNLSLTLLFLGTKYVYLVQTMLGKGPKAQRDVTTLKNNCQLFSRLFIACQGGGGNFDDFRMEIKLHHQLFH